MGGSPATVSQKGQVAAGVGGPGAQACPASVPQRCRVALGWDLYKRSPERSWGVGLAGVGLTLPRTPYGPGRRSGCTAAAGPLDCNPSYRAPKRQEKAFGAGSPLAKVPAALTSARWPTQKLGGQSQHAVGKTRTLWASGSRLRNEDLSSGLGLLVHGGTLPGSPAASPDGNLPPGGGRGRRRAPSDP